MHLFDLSDVKINKLITHHVGNKLRDEKYFLSNDISHIETSTSDYLIKYFLGTIKLEESFSFYHSVRLELNSVYSIVGALFSDINKFVQRSEELVKLLYDNSMHPKIREGEFNLVYFENIIYQDQIISALGIYKSETSIPYIRMIDSSSYYSINHEFGFELKGLDKGCLILNINSDFGFKVFINDSKSHETQYWIDDFLSIKPIKDEYHYTNDFLSITKNYLTKQINEEFEIEKADKIDLLNRSVEYFKKNEVFDRRAFEQEVLQDNNLVESFRNYKNSYEQQNDIKIEDSFEISTQAVKKQARVFKSVLKLDKNFHIYIHGNREMIERGVDETGRKFYKIYYQNEE